MALPRGFPSNHFTQSSLRALKDLRHPRSMTRRPLHTTPMHANSERPLYLLSPKYLPSQEVCCARIEGLQNRTFIRKDRESHALPIHRWMGRCHKGSVALVWVQQAKLSRLPQPRLHLLHYPTMVPAQNLIPFGLQVASLRRDIRPCLWKWFCKQDLVFAW